MNVLGKTVYRGIALTRGTRPSVKEKVAPCPTRPSAQTRPPMPVDDPLHGGETDAGAGELAREMEPLEGTEEPVHVRHVEARRRCRARSRSARPPTLVIPNSIRAGRLPGGELPGVLQQVGERDAEQLPVAGDVTPGRTLVSTARSGSALAQPLAGWPRRGRSGRPPAARSSARVTLERWSTSSMSCDICRLASRIRSKNRRPFASSRSPWLSSTARLNASIRRSGARRSWETA